MDKRVVRTQKRPWLIFVSVVGWLSWLTMMSYVARLGFENLQPTWLAYVWAVFIVIIVTFGLPVFLILRYARLKGNR